MKIERLLSITVLLLNRKRVVAQELADRFEVSVRTVYRDIQTLNGAGIPVVTYQGYGGGLCIPDNYKLSRQLLTFDDMLSILTTLKGVNRTLKNNDVEVAIEKIAALIPEDKDELYQKYSDSFIVDITGWGVGKRFQKTVKTVHGAVSKTVLLSFSYTGADGRKSQRLVEPHTLILKNFTWYLFAFCRVRGDFRLFRLSRMRLLVLEKNHFSRRKVDPWQSLYDHGDRPVVDLVLKFVPKLKIKVEEYFEEDQLQYEIDGSIIAKITLPEDDWILSFLLGFGSDMEVISPLHWRERLYKKCDEIQKIYTNMT